MILRSSFDSMQASIVYPITANMFMNNRPQHAACDAANDADLAFVLFKKPPALMIRHDFNSTHMFWHYNFTMVHCLWGRNMTTYDKVSVFSDMSDWLKSFNRSLQANFHDCDDWFAWNLAEFDNSEHHFD
jgi:hypothetical protein